MDVLTQVWHKISYNDKKIAEHISHMEHQFKSDQLYKLAMENATPAPARISRM